MEKIKLAVNGTLMRGLNLNQQILDTGGVFICESATAPIYRLWSIADKYPAMLRDVIQGASIQLEVWELSADALVQVLQQEPPGLTLGYVELADGWRILGVLAEPYICEGQQEITAWGGWRNFINSTQN